MRLGSFALFVGGYLAAEYNVSQKVVSVVPHEYRPVVYLLGVAIVLAMLFDHYVTPAFIRGKGSA